MVRTGKLKILVIVLIVLSLFILPTAFSVSYARWQGGSTSLNATVSVSGGTVSDKPFDISGFDWGGSNYGIATANGLLNIISNAPSIDPTTGIIDNFYANVTITDEQAPATVQVFISTEYDENGKVVFNPQPINLNPVSSVNVTHEDGSVNYVLERSGIYTFIINSGTLAIEFYSYN